MRKLLFTKVERKVRKYMPLKNGRVSNNERVFMEQTAATGNPVYAAAIAGYKHPAPRASQNLSNPEIVAGIRALQMKRMSNEALPLAVSTVVRAMTEPGVPWAQQLKAADITFKYVLANGEESDLKALHEMTGDQLTGAMSLLRARLDALNVNVIDHDETSPFD